MMLNLTWKTLMIFWKKLCSPTDLPNNIISCSVDVVGLYATITHEEGLSALEKSSKLRREKKVSTSTLVELAEVVLRNNVFTFGRKKKKKLRGTVIGTKFAPWYSILCRTELEEEMLREVKFKPYFWWWFIDNIFFSFENMEKRI